MKKFLITVAGLLAILIYSPAYASDKQVQVANCSDQVAYACCIQEAWAGVLWVNSKSKVTSYQDASDVCHHVDAIVDKWVIEDCTKDTSLFNQPSEERISSSCKITEYDHP